MENMNVNPEADPQISKKPSKMKAIFVAVLAVVLVLGGVYYFVFNQPEEGPPTLGAADQSLYQGLIQTGKYDFLSFDAEDVASWVNPDPEGDALHLEYANSKEGLHYIASNTETTLRQILDSMNPSETQGQLMIAVYDDGFFMSPNNYYAAGEGVPLTIVSVEDMDTVTIEPNRFIILASDKDIELWGDFYTIDTLPENFDFCNQEIEGWFPGAFSGNIADEFEVNVEGVSIDCMPDQLWALNENTLEFEEQDLASLTTLDTFIWVKYNMAPSDSIAAKLIEMESEEVEEPLVEESPVEELLVEEPLNGESILEEPLIEEPLVLEPPAEESEDLGIIFELAPLEAMQAEMPYLAFYSAHKNLPNDISYNPDIVNSGQGVLLGSFEVRSSGDHKLEGLTFTCADCENYLNNFILYYRFYDQGPYIVKLVESFTNNKLIFSFSDAPVRITSYGDYEFMIYGQISTNPNDEILALDLLPGDVVAEVSDTGESIEIKLCSLQDNIYQTGTQNGCTLSEAETYGITINQ